MTFEGAALPLREGDVDTIAGYLGCEVAVIRAVLAVESAGRGFAGKRPVILNERHILYRELGGDKRKRAVAAGLANRRSGDYPKTQAERYAWLAAAMAIDETAALRSCSWGLGQIMGFNHARCGFDTVQEFVEAMKHSEGAQLYAMARFIVSSDLARHLRSLNWTGFASGYNGSDYAKGEYHTKLEAAYRARPRSERRIPRPATSAELDALIGRGTVFYPMPGNSAATEEPTPEPAPAARNGGLRATLAAFLRWLFGKD